MFRDIPRCESSYNAVILAPLSLGGNPRLDWLEGGIGRGVSRVETGPMMLGYDWGLRVRLRRSVRS
ncbi:hypothetical protein Thiowin_02636 [Thiorhodovibrio winogradskyi]|uniref:Bacterial bifunctional deaminase-reductase C-terminal domain-containing protein n=1 Tax=Thiorhodovibrio winogradskyi TaxID=77007 RepID=A0ABZ0SBY8_9GAMM|nr:hypothetical protein [Thiorhodovibrio winogradskyi]